MLKEAMIDDRNDRPLSGVEEDTIKPDLIREELRRVVASRHFRTSKRGKEFLQFVVDQIMSGKGDLLKERLIGVQLFGRKPDYATGEDPVVRVQAGDVRRRLESYNSDPDVHSDILIQIPVGSYAPVFLMRERLKAPNTEQGIIGRPTGGGATPSDANYVLLPEACESKAPSSTGVFSAAAEALPPSRSEDPQPDVALAPVQVRAGWLTKYLWRAGISAVACIALALYLFSFYLHRSPDWIAKAFWSPASVSTKPVLICLPKPIVYRPSEKLYDEYAGTHPNAFVTREARRDQLLPLAPTDPIRWGDMTPVRNSGPGIGAVVAAVNIGKMLAEQGIRFELRFGEEATYADMRASPVVIVGAINTEWTNELTSGSDFTFDESREAPNIHETGGAKRVWKMESSGGNITRDYGLITRQMSGKSGQSLVQVAGISHFGTEAASEFLANKKELARALRSNSINLQEKSFQIIVSTDVTAGRAGPPHVVAIGSW